MDHLCRAQALIGLGLELVLRFVEVQSSGDGVYEKHDATGTLMKSKLSLLPCVRISICRGLA